MVAKFQPPSAPRFGARGRFWEAGPADWAKCATFRGLSGAFWTLKGEDLYLFRSHRQPKSHKDTFKNFKTLKAFESLKNLNILGCAK